MSLGVNGSTSVINVERGSYIGTGEIKTSNDPMSITFDVAPDYVWLYATSGDTYAAAAQTELNGTQARYGFPVNMKELGTSFTMGPMPNNYQPGSSWAKKSSDGKTLSWYGNYRNAATWSNNNANTTYYYFGVKFAD